MSKKHPLPYSLILLSCILAWASCKDIFEVDLSNGHVSVLAPTDNLSTNIVTQTFWWEEVDGALEYKLQIVSPSFSSVQTLVLDSLIEDNVFTYTLVPGTYQWRVQAINGSSQTEFTTHTLVIDTTSDLSGQIILLQGPGNNAYLNSATQTFTWNSIYNATGYDVQVASPDFTSSANVVLDTNVSANSINYTFSNEGSYEWKVRATNGSGQSQFSQVRGFYIDVTAPNIPTLVLPTNYDTITNPSSLYWDRGVISGSAITDTLYLYSDSLVTLLYKEEKTGTSHTDSLAVGSYFWKLRSIDRAGNISGYSELRKFTVE